MKTLKLLTRILIIFVDISYLVFMLYVGFSMVGNSYEAGVYSNFSPVIALSISLFPFLLGCFTVVGFTTKID